MFLICEVYPVRNGRDATIGWRHRVKHIAYTPGWAAVLFNRLCNSIGESLNDTVWAEVINEQGRHVFVKPLCSPANPDPKDIPY